MLGDCVEVPDGDCVADMDRDTVKLDVALLEGVEETDALGVGDGVALIEGDSVWLCD